MWSFVRSLVAWPKVGFIDSQLSIPFDMTYVTSNVIVCAGPTNQLLKKVYRYPVGDLVMILMANHGDSWHIWNFRGEGKGYSDSDVLGKISYFPFPDHQAPTLQLIYDSVVSIDRFLEHSANNVAVLHCKAGKGRSGTMFCAYALYKSYKNGRTPDVTETMNLYTEKRMRAGVGGGVTIKSQIRYLVYWSAFLQVCAGIDEVPRMLQDISRTVKVGRITLAGASDFLTGNLYNLFSIKLGIQTYKKRKDAAGVDIHDLATVRSSNFDVELDGTTIVATPKFVFYATNDIRISFKSCYFWFDPRFESDNSFKIAWEEIDGVKGLPFKGAKLFESMEIQWE